MMADVRCAAHGALVEVGEDDKIVHIARKDECDSGEFDITSYDVDRITAFAVMSFKAADRGPWAPAGGHPVPS